MSCVINPRFQIRLATEPLSLTTNNQWTQWGEIDYFIHNSVFTRYLCTHLFNSFNAIAVIKNVTENCREDIQKSNKIRKAQNEHLNIVYQKLNSL